MSSLPQPGALIGGKYRVGRVLGAGGMGVVFEASNELTDKKVAIKVLQPQFAARAEHVQRMLREAQASARIRHPNVVDIFDVGSEGDTLFLVMEYLEGETLAAKLGRGVLSTPEALELLMPAMRGVAAGHACGIVHRDVKPENIFLARLPGYHKLVSKVLDFGISKVSSLSGDDPTLTASGATLGTPLYMSYEQLSGVRDIDARADVYAFGVILYEALTGRRPFTAETIGGLAVQIATTTPKLPSELRAGLRLGLDEVVMRAIARSRDARYSSLDALILALAPFAGEAGPVLGLTTLPAMGSVSPLSEAPGPSEPPHGTAHVSGTANTVVARAPADTPRPGGPARVRVALWAASLVVLVLGYLLLRGTSSTAARDTEAHRPAAKVADRASKLAASASPAPTDGPNIAVEGRRPVIERAPARSGPSEQPGTAGPAVPVVETAPVAATPRARPSRSAPRDVRSSPTPDAKAAENQAETPARAVPLLRAGKPSLDEF